MKRAKKGKRRDRKLVRVVHVKEPGSDFVSHQAELRAAALRRNVEAWALGPEAERMASKQREARTAEAIGGDLFSELLLTYAELRLLEKHEEAVGVGLKLLPYIKPKLRSHEHKVVEEVKIRFTVGGE